MIKNYPITVEDIATYENIKDRECVHFQQPDTYQQKIVEKPWGYEFLCFENDFIAVWFLFIASGHSTSMHSHPQKRTSLILLDGMGFHKTLYQHTILRSSDVIMMDSGVFHATKALTDIELIEIEAPPIKTDLCRLKDNYGRERTGYEDISKMTKDEQVYFSLNSCDWFSRKTYRISRMCILHEKIPYFLSNDNYICFTEGDDGGYIKEPKDVPKYSEAREILSFSFGGSNVYPSRRSNR